MVVYQVKTRTFQVMQANVGKRGMNHLGLPNSHVITIVKLNKNVFLSQVITEFYRPSLAYHV